MQGLSHLGQVGPPAKLLLPVGGGALVQAVRGRSVYPLLSADGSRLKSHHNCRVRDTTAWTMASASRIDVLQEDRGLATCLSAANLLDTWTAPFLKHHGIETLEDFVFLVPKDDTDKGIKALVDGVQALRDKPIVLARFKAAYESGLQAVKQASQPAAKSSDMDEILPESTMATIAKDFRTRYNFDIDASLEPSDTLRSRIYREFKKQTMTVIEARRIKSVLEQAGPKLQESVSLPGGLKLEFDKDSPVDITSAVHYYWALRTLAYGWAWAGNFRHKDPDGKERLFISLAEATTYADDALRATMDYGGGSLLWMNRNDLLTRGKMASAIRRGWSAGKALRDALQQCHLEWRSPAMQLTPDTNKLKRPAEPAMPPRASSPKRPRLVKSDKYQTVSMVKGGRRICKKYNDGRGCSGCDDIHGCDVKLPSGKACLSTKHNRLNHAAE